MNLVNQPLEVLVRGFIVNSNNEVLLVKSRTRNWWFFPGGHLEAGETVYDRLRRELSEEAQLEVMPKKFEGIVEHSYSEDGSFHLELNLLVSAYAQSDVGQTEPRLEFRWFSVRDVQDLVVFPEAVKSCFLSCDDKEIFVNLFGLK